MNNIIVTDSSITSSSNDIEIKKNVITFLRSGTYFIDYSNTKEINLNFIIDDDIKVNLSEISFDNDLVINNRYIINKGFLTVNKFYSNKSVLENILIDLNSNGARIDYNFSNICLINEKYTIDINHNCKKTISNISNKSVAMDNSRIKFIINSNVPKNMSDSILDQTTKIITFGDADASISPNMFIDTYDVVAKHGSVVGTVDDDMMFYLMSRGISYNDALRLVIKGYLLSNVLMDFNIRTQIIKIIDLYWR